MNLTQKMNLFLSLFSHDLRSPIGNIQNSVDLLESTEQDEFQRELTHLIRVSASTAMDLMEEQLLLNQIETNKFISQSKTMDQQMLVDFVHLQIANAVADRAFKIDSKINFSTVIELDDRLFGFLLRFLLRALSKDPKVKRTEVWLSTSRDEILTKITICSGSHAGVQERFFTSLGFLLDSDSPWSIIANELFATTSVKFNDNEVEIAIALPNMDTEDFVYPRIAQWSQLGGEH